jgi:TonB family protein
MSVITCVSRVLHSVILANHTHLRSFGIWLVLVSLTCPPARSWQDSPVSHTQQPGWNMLVKPLAETFSQSDRKIIVMPLADAENNVSALGAYLSGQISQRMKELFPQIEIINPETLKVPARSDSKLEVPESDTEELKTLAWSAGAEICILGDFAPFKDEIGISLHAWRSDRSMLADSYGSIPLAPEMRELAPKLLKYTPPADGIFIAGGGGVSWPKPLSPSKSNSTGSNRDFGAGLVSMSLVVGTDGEVQQIVILESSSASLASRAVKLFHSLKYTPAKAPDGTAVPARVYLKFAVVELELTISSDGSVQQARVLESPNQSLSDRAIQSVKKWKFKPATSPAGQSVAAKVPTEITFTLYSK